LHGAHTGENQGHVIFSVLQEFGLSKKVGYFTLDNASNNDTALQFLCKRLQEQGISLILLSIVYAVLVILSILFQGFFVWQRY